MNSQEEKTEKYKRKNQRLLDEISVLGAGDIQKISFLKVYANNILQQKMVYRFLVVQIYIQMAIALGFGIMGIVTVIEGLGRIAITATEQKTKLIVCMFIVAIFFEVLSGISLWLTRELIQQLAQYRNDLYNSEQLIFLLAAVDSIIDGKNQEQNEIRNLYMRVVESELRKREHPLR